MFDNFHSNFNLDNINCNFDDFGDAELFHRSIDFEFDDICHSKVPFIYHLDNQMLLSNEEVHNDKMLIHHSEIWENTQYQQKASIVSWL